MSRCAAILAVCMSLVRLATALEACASPGVCTCSGTTVDCDSSSLTEVPNNIPVSTTELRLRHNQITVITPQTFVGLQDLRRLYLNNNNISVVEPGSFQHLLELGILYLAYNKLASLHTGTFAALYKLVILDLSNNNIVTLDHDIFNGLNQLSTLDVSYNSVTAIPSSVATLRNLEYFKMQHNEITDIQPGFFSNSAWFYLDLSYNNITMIQDGTFSNMTISQTFELSLEGNPIKQFGKYSFSNIISRSGFRFYWFEMDFKSMQLEKIHELAFHNVLGSPLPCDACEFIFNNNLLETIPSSLCNLTFVRYTGADDVRLYLDNNPLSCDCRMREVLHCLSLILDYEELTCRYPPALNNRFLYSLNREDLVCSSPAIDYISSTVHQAKVGETVTLYCNATGFNRPTLTWTLPPVPPGGTPSDRQHHEVRAANLDYNSTESTLIITHVQMSDQGSYTCQASNAAGVDSMSLSLTVIPDDGQGQRTLAAAIGGTVGAVVLCIILGLIYFMHKRRQNKNNSSNLPSAQKTQQTTKHSNPEFEEDDVEYDDVRIDEPRGPATIEIHHGRPVIGSAENQGTTAIQGAASAEGAGHLYQGLVHENPDHVYTSLQDGANASGGRDEGTVGDGGRRDQNRRPQQGLQAQAGQTTEGSGGDVRGHVYQSLRLETPGHVYTSLRGEEATPGDANGRQDIANADHGYQNPGDITAELSAEEPYEEPIASPQYYNIPGDDYHDYLSLRDD